MVKSRKFLSLILFITLLLTAFVSLMITSGIWGGNAKLDMTDNKRYSLSSASEKILSELKSPILIRVYLSNALTKENALYAGYAPYVLRFLKKYQQAAAKDKIKIEIINPEPYSPQEEEAKTAGLKPLADSSGQTSLYFGAVFSGDGQQNYVIPNFIVARSGYLENDITRILAKLNTQEHPTVGLISPALPLINRQYGKAIPNWAIVAQLQNDYNIVEFSDKTVQIPAGVKVLIVVNPAELSPLLLYALDQYVLRGGKLLVISDVFSEKQAELYTAASARSADLNKLFRNWGFEEDYQTVSGSNGQGELMLMDSPDGSRVKKFPFWMLLNKEQINQQHPLTAGLSRIRLKTPGKLSPLSPEGKVQITPLLTINTEAGSLPQQEFMLRNQTELANIFQPDSQTHILALLAEGSFDSLFTRNILANTQFEGQMYAYLPSSIAPAQIIAVADSDFLVAENWADTTETTGNPVYGLSPIFDNGSFILRAVDFLSGKTELLGLNNKENSNFQTVGQAVYNNVFNRHANEYNKLQQELNTRLSALQNQEKTINASPTALTTELAGKMEENKNRINELKKQLKQKEYLVKRENEQRLNNIVTLNTIVIPAVIIALLILTALWLRRRRFKQTKEMLNEASAD